MFYTAIRVTRWVDFHSVNFILMKWRCQRFTNKILMILISLCILKLNCPPKFGLAKILGLIGWSIGRYESVRILTHFMACFSYGFYPQRCTLTIEARSLVENALLHNLDSDSMVFCLSRQALLFCFYQLIMDNF